MKKNILLVLLLVVAIGCKKDKFSDDDTTVYEWKRDLYRASLPKEGPAIFLSRYGKLEDSHSAILLNSDLVILTEYRKDKQQDSIYKASGKMQVYKYEKNERVGD
jgi:hypothetical protein